MSQDEIALYGLWIQSGAIVVSAIGVIATLIWHKGIASRRATLDIVLLEQNDGNLVAQRTDFVRLRDAGHLAQWADPSRTATDEAAIIRAVLNRYELIAIGIREGTIDEKSYRNWCRTTLVKDWVACKPMVMQLRQNAGVAVYFSQFERLAAKWATPAEKGHV